MRSYWDHALALSRRKNHAQSRIYKASKCTNSRVIHRHLGIMEAKAFIGFSRLQAPSKSITVLTGRKIFQRCTYAPRLSYYAIEFPQNSYAGRRINWCQPEGTHVSRKENPLSADNCQITLEEQPEPDGNDDLNHSVTRTASGPIYFLPQFHVRTLKMHLEGQGQYLSVPVPSMGSLK